MTNLSVKLEDVPLHTYRYDIADRLVYEKQAGGLQIDTAYEYPANGQLKKTTTETLSEGDTRTSVEWYDALDRLVKVKQPNGAYTQYLYDLDDRWVRSWISKPNYSVQDPEASYGSDRTNSFVVKREYDLRGRMLSEDDPNRGVVSYTYTELDKIESQTDANGIVTRYSYDRLGRKTSIKRTEGTICYYYDRHVTNYNDRYTLPNFWATGNLIELRQFSRNVPCYIDGHWNTGDTNVSDAWIRRVSYVYNEKGQLEYLNQDMESAGYQKYDADFIYDEKGRLLQKVHPGGSFTTEYKYDDFSGKLKSVKDVSTGVIYRSIESYDVFGNVKDEWLGENIEVNRTFSPTTGRPSTLKAYSNGSLVLDTKNTFDSEGKLAQYNENAVYIGSTQFGNYQETYHYDDIAKQQLTSVDSTNGLGQYKYVYDALGNIRQHNGAAYIYDESYPHRLTSVGNNSYVYDLAGNIVSDGGRSYKYQAESSGFKPRLGLTDPIFDLGSKYSNYKVEGHLPAQITQGNRVTQYVYGPDNAILLRRDVSNYQPTGSSGTYGTHTGERLSESTVVQETWYFEGMKLLQSKENSERLFDVTAGVEVTLKQYNGSTRFVQYKVMDHQGSVLMTLTDDGTVKQRLRYKPFGDTEVLYSADISITGQLVRWDDLTTEEGYTGHSGISGMSLIHMGGRVYDSVVGRFLQPDIVVQEPRNILSYNRYAYVWNDPNKYTDPTGYEVEWWESTKSTVKGWFSSRNNLERPDDTHVRTGDQQLHNGCAQGACWSQNNGGLVDDGSCPNCHGTLPNGSITTYEDRLFLQKEVLPIVALTAATPVLAGCLASAICGTSVAGGLFIESGDPANLIVGPGSAPKPFALGIDDYLDDFAKMRNATTWKQLDDVENWRPQVLDKILDPDQKVLFNLDGVDVWTGVTRAASGRGGATDWELLQIRQNPQAWDTIDFFKDGSKVENPFQ